MTPYDVVIVGSGFGGSILARALNQRGLRVALVERSRHPRFALGESSTPLAALSLERLATDFALPDLHQLAAYGRWQRSLPSLGCGLKRGFTFYDHRRGEPERTPRSTLLVAASPDDARADCHWLRSDVDHHLFQRAQAEGVDCLDRTEVVDVAADDRGVALTLAVAGAPPSTLRAGMLVDATGPGGLAQRHLGVEAGPCPTTRSSLIFGHFDGVSVPEASPAVYEPHRAAVHHLIDGGWIYELPFDSGRVSAGALLVDAPEGDAAEAWTALVASYPALAARYASARPVGPLGSRRTLQHRLARASGPRWVALPHTFGFVDPLFSTGIAWTLRGVERLARTLAETPGSGRDAALARYESLLQKEFTQIDRLVHGAYSAMADFELFAAYSLTYFATVSWSEIQQRLLQPSEPMWEAFLGAEDPALATLFADARAALPSSAARRAIEEYRRWILERIEPRDIAGLDRYGPELSVPVDFDILIERAPRLGLDAATVRSRLHLLRGEA